MLALQPARPSWSRGIVRAVWEPCQRAASRLRLLARLARHRSDIETRSLRGWAAPCAAAVVGIALVGPGLVLGASRTEAQARDAPASLTARLHSPAWIDLRVSGPAGSTVEVSERVDGRIRRIATATLADRTLRLSKAAQWRCDRQQRRFVAVIRQAGGSETREVAVRTPSCRNRLAISLARRLVPGSRTTLRVRDRWRLGSRARVCVLPPGGLYDCEWRSLPAGAKPLRIPVVGGRPGTWTVGVALPGAGAHKRTLLVRRPNGRLRLLATGDSEIQLIDLFLAEALRHDGVRVRSDAHISTGISKPFLLNWVAYARYQARRIRPDVTVMFIGGNDGFPMRGPSGRIAYCCKAAWVDEFARRTRLMIRSYLRGDAGRVYWFLLPPPSRRGLAGYFRAANRGFIRAARSFPGRMRLVDVRGLSGREPDGYHLSIRAMRVATRMVVTMLRDDGVIGPAPSSGTSK